MQEVKAIARFVRVSPRKARLVVDLIRHMSIADARVQLRYSKKQVSEAVLKVLNSAVANAIHNNGMKEESLKIAAAYVDGGPIMYRYRPRAHGRAFPIRKRTSHITIVVAGEETNSAKPGHATPGKSAPNAEKKEEVATEDKKAPAKKPTAKPKTENPAKPGHATPGKKSKKPVAKKPAANPAKPDQAPPGKPVAKKAAPKKPAAKKPATDKSKTTKAKSSK